MPLFLTLFACYAFFFQGGGWNQNSRFDQVRALAETGSLSIHDYMAFVAVTDDRGGTLPRRIPLSEPTPPQVARLIYNTGDVSSAGGGVYPNKPPGVTFLALPAYWLLWRVERLLGIDPDGAWAQTIGAYLTTLLSIGLIGACAGPLFYRASLLLFASVPRLYHAAAALAFGLGTLMFPFSTLLFDHVPVAFLSLLAFYLLVLDPEGAGGRATALRPAAAGLVAGAAVLCNYAAILTVALLTVYLAATAGARTRVPLFLAGGLIPALELAAYQLACFGSPLALATSSQSPLFTDPGARWLGAFALPEPLALAGILFTPYRGLFFSSPVLALALYGWWRMWRGPRRREAMLCGAVFAAFVLMNAAFRQWDAGSTFGPRYLVPALPFLALPLAPAIQRLPRLALALGLVSFSMMLTATAVDPQVPFDVAHPWGDYLLPLAAGKSVTFPLYRVEGPVSANPQGVFEGYPYDIFQAGSEAATWNSFNLGELLWPRSRLSLVPLLIVIAPGLAWTRRRATG